MHSSKLCTLKLMEITFLLEIMPLDYSYHTHLLTSVLPADNDYGAVAC